MKIIYLHGKKKKKKVRPLVYWDWGAKTDAALRIPKRKYVDAKI